ncbi:MAG: tetratricopeptide repeat protein, partial [Microcoleus sp.]
MTKKPHRLIPQIMAAALTLFGVVACATTASTPATQTQINDANAYYSQGLARANQGDLKGAVDDFSKAISLKPDYADAYFKRANAKYDLGKKAEALS